MFSQFKNRTALKIADALDVHLSGQEQQGIQHRYTDNAQAYEAFCMGKLYFRPP